MSRRVLTLTAVALLAAAPAWGQRGQRESVDRLEAESRDRARERDDLRADARAAAREVERLRGRLVGLARAQSGDERQAAVQRARFEALNAQEAALTRRMAADRVRMTRLLGALQVYSRDPPPALLVSPERATDAVRAAILMRAVAPELERRAAALKREADGVSRVRRQAALAGAALFAAESEVEDRRAEIERLIAEKTALEVRLNADAAQAQAEALALAEEASDLRGLVQGLARRPGDPDLLDPDRTDLFGRRAKLTAPVQGVVVRRFGERSAAGARSDGWTWRVPPGAQVLSPAEGRVEYAGPLKGWDQVLVIRLGGGAHLVLAGLETVATGAGRSVAGGEPVGRMPAPEKGATELYLEIRRDGAPVDPARWLDAGPAG
ncbi:MAG TPA: peptidoglycan DD-metalloendopeptidase family protein [Caulobacteraceae bacterium]|nr:peptidoglycan DD-metalloendopeptidase family protein [Caulobacteraceae bacterium]